MPSANKAAATTVTVKGTDSSVTVSPKTFFVGTVTFRITNNGRLAHVFVVAGKRTSVKPHRTVSAKVTFRSAGRFTYTWTGKKSITGKLTVKRRVVVTTTTAGTTTTTTTTTTATTTTTTATTTTVTGPASTVAVGMFEYRFDMVPATVPSGTITFVVTNKGAEPHNFDIAGVKATAILGPGQTETFTVGLAPKHYIVVCDVPFHIDRGMQSEFVVS